MRKFFAIYLSILCFLPILANATLCGNDQGCVACVKDGGKWWDDFEIQEDKCKNCPDNQYHPDCSADTSTCEMNCTTITDGAHYRSNDGKSQKQCPSPANNNGPEFVTTSDPEQYIGNCSCGAVGNTNLNIIRTLAAGGQYKYYCGTCNNGIPDLTPNTCTCGLNSNRVFGKIVDNIKVECECPSDSTYITTGNSWDTGKCECDPNSGKVPKSGGLTIDGQMVNRYRCCLDSTGVVYNAVNDRCECRVPGAKIVRDNSGDLTFCGCSNVDGVTMSNVNNRCVCQSPTTKIAVMQNQDQASTLYTNEPNKYLDHCLDCKIPASDQSCVSLSDYSEDNIYPQFCKCAENCYQNAATSVSNPRPLCSKCPTLMTRTPQKGSVDASSCRLNPNLKFYTNINDTHGMKLIPSGTNIQILPEYNDPYSNGTPTTGGGTAAGANTLQH